MARKKRDLLPRLQKLIKKYPRVPAFKNYLSTYYSLKGKNEKAFEVNRWLCKEHPDYLHGKINLATQHIQEENYDDRFRDIREDKHLGWGEQPTVKRETPKVGRNEPCPCGSGKKYKKCCLKKK